jgi:hypothetical protein
LIETYRSTSLRKRLTALSIFDADLACPGRIFEPALSIRKWGVKAS